MNAPKYITTHARFDEEDYAHLSNKGYTNREIEKIWNRDLKRETPTRVTGNEREYSWAEINQALMDTGHSAKAIVKIMFALKKNQNQE